MPASLHTQLSECRSVLARERDALAAARANVDTLRTENARLRAAFESLVDCSNPYQARKTARAALDGAR